MQPTDLNCSHIKICAPAKLCATPINFKPSNKFRNLKRIVGPIMKTVIQVANAESKNKLHDMFNYPLPF